MTYLDSVLRFFSKEDFSNREDLAVIISNIYEENPEITIEEFKKKVRAINRDFFRANRLNRDNFSESVFKILTAQKVLEEDKNSKFLSAQKFIQKFFEVGYKKTEHQEERTNLIRELTRISKPHEKVMKALNEVLDLLVSSYSLNLHGVKEYSGIDIAKEVNGATIGFQIKTRSDDISENMILSEVTKAQNFAINGFILVYARANNKTVESSILGAYHIFQSLKERRKIYSAIVDPELLAELLRLNSIKISTA